MSDKVEKVIKVKKKWGGCIARWSTVVLGNPAATRVRTVLTIDFGQESDEGYRLDSFAQLWR